jgi:mRNA interferase RelE/StbE
MHNPGLRALKDVARLDRPMRERIVAAVERFAETGMGDVRRLRGKEQEIYRLRVGEWRVLFARRKTRVILVLRVRPRASAYQP